jgi:hypothetical protein
MRSSETERNAMGQNLECEASGASFTVTLTSLDFKTIAARRVQLHSGSISGFESVELLEQ